MRHWHCGHVGQQTQLFNLGWDFSDWALPLRIVWDGLVIGVQVGPVELRYNRKECREEFNDLDDALKGD